MYFFPAGNASAYRSLLGPPDPKSKESDLELKLNELVVELGRSLQKIAQPIQSSMNRTLMSVWQLTTSYPSSWGGGEALEEATLAHAIYPVKPHVQSRRRWPLRFVENGIKENDS